MWMRYIIFVIEFYILCVIPIQISAYYGAGYASLGGHTVALAVATIIYKLRPHLFGTRPEYMFLIVSVVNVIGFAANFVGR